MNLSRLQNEIKLWIGEGIITSAQGEKIIARYDGETPIYKRMSFWLKCVAAVLVGFALFLVISENWQQFPWLMQSLIAALPLVAAQGWAFFEDRRGNEKTAEVGWFFASIALGANIMLQAQIFHISSYYPNGVLYWVIGILPVVILRMSIVTYLLAASLFFMYLTMQLDHRQFSLVSLVPLATFSWFAFARQRFYTLVPFLLVLQFFLFTIFEHWQIRVDAMLWAFASVLLSVAITINMHDLAERWLLRTLGLILAFTLVLNMVMTFSLSHWHAGSSFVWIVCVAAAVSIALQWARYRAGALTLIVSANASATILVIALVGLSLGKDETDYDRVAVKIAANLVYLGTVVALILQAIKERAKGMFLGAVTALLIWAFVRYLDLFKNYLMTALIFVLCAFALVAMNKLWEKKYGN